MYEVYKIYKQQFYNGIVFVFFWSWVPDSGKNYEVQIYIICLTFEIPGGGVSQRWI